MALQLADLNGVGPRMQEKLGHLGVGAVEDLLFHLPLRYEDRTRMHAIGSLRPGTRVLIEGEVQHSAVVRARRAMLVVVLSTTVSLMV